MRIIALILLPLSLFTSQPFFAFFTPPPGWVLGDPQTLQGGAKVGFVASKRKAISPSIVMTIENIGEADLETYMKAVARLHKKKTYRELGAIPSKAGIGKIIQIDEKHEWGVSRMLQAITLVSGHAIILAGVTPKEEFLTYHQALLKAFQSLTVAPTLCASCRDSQLSEKVTEMMICWKKYRLSSTAPPSTLFSSTLFQKNQWEPFVDYVKNSLKSQGSCWQFLAIRSTYETLINGE
ncbi:MAG: hypothetical protein KDK60_03880 [Chlamydiia bacterium]|nr:hypothetical protein [Chlamydiia bacterium]